MSPTSERAERKAVAMAVAMAVAVAVAIASGCKYEPTVWFEGTMDQALAAAVERKTVVVATVTAEWCPACHELERNFWNARAGSKASREWVLVKVDYDKPEGRKFVVRYHVMNLPTTVVLDAKGRELGRIVGFDGQKEYGAKLESAVESLTPTLDELQRVHLRNPDDLQASLVLGEAFLSQGLEQQGVDVLEQVMEKDPANEAGAYMDAARCLGRYFVRCRQEFYRGQEYFENAQKKFPDAKESWGFRYWIGTSLWESGEEKEALAYFEKVVKDYPGKAEAHSIRAEFLQKQGKELETALAEARKAVELDPKDDWNHYLEAEILKAMGRKDEAEKALGKAIEIAPQSALYLDRKQDWCGK